MNLSEPFIRRPIATSLLMAGIIILGLIGYFSLPISALPQVDFPTIQVTCRYPGASPEVMASSVTTPLERQFGQISGLSSMTSVSSFGTSVIVLQFALNRDIDAAGQDVQSAINAAGGVLPKGMPAPPTYSKVNPADAPILTLSISSETLPLEKVNDYADTLLAQKLSEVRGVGLVTIQGDQKPAVRVRINPTALSALGLGLEDIRTALQQNNINQPKGSFDGPRQSFTIGANDQITSAQDYASVIVAYRNGAPVRLGDLGEVVNNVENIRLAGWVDGKSSVILDIQRQPGANIIETVDRVKALLPTLRASLPPSLKVEILADRTTTIRASVEDVQFTLLLTTALVVMVIFIFLRRFWATAIPSVALPLAIIGTFGVMALAGFSLDNLSLMALTVATGFVVDDAIVMIENIVRYLEAGDSPLEAALKGSRQIGFTIISLSLSLIAVFIPLLFMTGIVGRLFREFAITLSVSVIVSAFVSLTLTPMMCAKFLTTEGNHAMANHGMLFRTSERWFARLLYLYRESLQWVLRHQTTTLVVAIATLVATVWLYIVVPKGLLPDQDTGVLMGVTDTAQSISFQAMSERQRRVAETVRLDPDVAHVASFVGGGVDNSTVNTGRLYVILKPRELRKSSANQVIDRLREATKDITGISLYLQAAQDVQIDSRISRTQYQYTLQDANEAELSEWAPKLLEKLRTLPELSDVASDQQSGGLSVVVDINRQQAARYNVPVQAIDDALYDAFGQRQVSIIFTQLNQYRVILEALPRFQRTPASLEKVYVKSSSGQMVPLTSLATFRTVNSSLAIVHEEQFPAVTLSFNVRSGSSLGAAVKAIQKAQRKIGLPDTITTRFSGSASEFASSLESEPWLILAAVVVIYIVLGMLYESYIHPITILSTLPSAGLGALLAMILCGIDLSLISLIGIILLIGIVKKNAIMMIDFALDASRERSVSAEDGIYQACLMRFRPIMMTTFAALFGALPLALGHGPGSELRRPLGIAIVGGLLVSQVLTLYTTPVIYLYMDRLRKRFGESRTRDVGPVNISEPFIRRPVATTMLSVGLFLLGITAFQLLPVAPLPKVDFPAIAVFAGIPGADPATVAASLTAPLEKHLCQIPGVNEVTSSSTLGGCWITVQFQLDRNIDSAARDVQAALNAATPDLPINLPGPPGFRKLNPSDSPILILSMTSETLPSSKVFQCADEIVAQKICQVTGVSQVTINGAEKSAVRVQADPSALASVGLGLEDLRTFLGGINTQLPKGSLEGKFRSFSIISNDQLLTAGDYADLIIKQRHGAPILLSSVANVVDGVENTRLAGWNGTKPAVILLVFKKPNANVIETVDQIKESLPQLEKWIPPGTRITVMNDRTKTIRASVHEVEIALIASVVLVVVVMLLFLRRFWPTFIASVSVPLSLAGTFGAMYLLGYSLDNLSLMALAVSVGFVVDDAIVVIENIVRYVEEGLSPFEAAMRGTRQIGFTIISITLSLVAVFIPLLFMGGLIGRLFHEFSVTLCVAIIFSAFVSLTLIPMLCSRHLKPEAGQKHNALMRWCERQTESLLDFYRRSLRWSLSRQGLMIAIFLLSIGLTFWLYQIVPKGFFPQQDTGVINGTTEAAPDISFAAMTELQRQAAEIVLADPAVETVASFIGGGVMSSGRMFITLKPIEVRKLKVDEVIARIRNSLTAARGINLYMQPSQDLRFGGRSGKAQYIYSLQGQDLNALTAWGTRLVEKLRTVPQLKDVSSDRLNAGLQSNVVVDRDAASKLGLSLQLIDDTLYDAFGQRQVGTIYERYNQHHVILEVDPDFQKGPSSLSKIFVRSPSGKQVPLSAVAKFELSNTLLSVNHQGQFPCINITFNLGEGVSLGQATELIDQARQEIHMPQDIKGGFQGNAMVFQSTFQGLPFLILAALVAVYIVLGMLYENLIHPLTILSTLPSAGLGALLALILCGSELTLVSFIGIILLMGIVKKNAIMMVDFALESERTRGIASKEAIYEACIVRFRPILMTTLAAMFGAVPLAIGFGTGSELRQPLGIAVVGGLVVSQVLTLYTTPAIYVGFARMKPWWSLWTGALLSRIGLGKKSPVSS